VADSSLAPVLAFVAVAAVFVVTPGVGTAFLTSTVISHGRRAGYLTALGLFSGAVTYAVAAALGTATLLRVFPRSLAWIAVGGGAFIIWLGLRGLIAIARGPRVPAAQPAAMTGRRAFVLTGFTVAMGNASYPLFYLVIVPQYVPKTMGRLSGALLLSALHLLMAGTWMTTLVTLLGRLIDVLRRPRVLLMMQLLTGFALIWLGATSIRGAL
jgi:threonine/homoserine/homoserine lactone efflux protein